MSTVIGGVMWNKTFVRSGRVDVTDFIHESQILTHQVDCVCHVCILWWENSTYGTNFTVIQRWSWNLRIALLTYCILWLFNVHLMNCRTNSGLMSIFLVSDSCIFPTFFQIVEMVIVGKVIKCLSSLCFSKMLTWRSEWPAAADYEPVWAISVRLRSEFWC